jgi:glycerate dehydrogenase
VPAYGTASVAQATFALLLELTNQVGLHDRRVHEGAWIASKDFCFWETPLTELAGRTLGIIGYGTIGRAVSKIASAFGMKTLVVTRTGTASEEVRTVDLETLLRESDVVSLHCPLTEATRHLINAERLACMKQSALLINTSRGALVDEPALAAALNEGRLAGAGLDVLSAEPPPADNPLLHAKNCIITPHVAWATRSARERLIAVAIDNVRAFLDGKSLHVVNL